LIEAIIGIVGVLVSVVTFYAGIRRGERQERERREHELALERERQRHDREMEDQRHERELVSKVADEYVRMARSALDSGPHALARIGLEVLGSDRLVRQAIHEMHVRSGNDPWAGHAKHVEEVDLVEFFKLVREKNYNFFTISVQDVANQVRASAKRAG
jgi:hypothetical protein